MRSEGAAVVPFALAIDLVTFWASLDCVIVGAQSLSLIQIFGLYGQGLQSLSVLLKAGV